MWIAISNAIGQRVGTGGGPGPSPGYTPPLDTYTGATAAYSVRKLSSTYSGSCIEAYRVIDGATQDIGFDGDGLIDTAAIIAFGGPSEVRVRTWYDQSGNGLDAVQTTAADMPRIYDGSTIYEEGGEPTLSWAVQGIHMDTSPNENLTAQSTFMVFKMLPTTGGFGRMLTQSVNGNADYIDGSIIGRDAGNTSLDTSYSGFGRVINSSFSSTSNNLLSATISGTTLTSRLPAINEEVTNSSLTGPYSQNPVTIRTIGGSSGFAQHRFVGSLQEIILYDVDHFSRKIEAGDRRSTFTQEVIRIHTGTTA